LPGLAANPVSLEEANRVYHTAFMKGQFQAIQLKLDYSVKMEWVNEWTRDADSIVKKLLDLLLKQLGAICEEIVYHIQFEGAIALLNYAKGQEKAIDQEIYKLFAQGKNLTERFRGMHFTICVGEPVDDLCFAVRSKEQVRDVEWARMFRGVGKVIRAAEIGAEISAELNGAFGKKCELLKAHLEKAFEALDINAYRLCMEEFFFCHTAVLCQREARMFIRGMLDDFFKINRTLAGTYTDADNLELTTRNALHLCSNFMAYRETIISQISNILEAINENIQKKNIRPVRQACAYVERNYEKQINMEELAEYLGLNPAYFSHLFKKEMGRNFTEYVLDCRMRAARELLKSSNKNIAEIGVSLGYADTRYFSKVFKKHVGVKPTEYRKIYG
jgi:two-component system response regulator YesN